MTDASKLVQRNLP